MYPKEEDERDQARADAQALADVRTLDAYGIRWATVDYQGPDNGDPNTRWRCEVGTQAAWEDATPEGARAKAAEWVRKQAATPGEGQKGSP